MPKDTKSLGNNKAPACESRGFVRKKKKVCFLTHLLDAFMDSGVFSLYPFLSRTPEIPSQTSEILSATWVCTKSDIETPECDLASPESCLVVRVRRLRFRRPMVRRAFPSPALRFLSPCGRKCPGP